MNSPAPGASASFVGAQDRTSRRPVGAGPAAARSRLRPGHALPIVPVGPLAVFLRRSRKAARASLASRIGLFLLAATFAAWSVPFGAGLAEAAADPGAAAAIHADCGDSHHGPSAHHAHVGVRSAGAVEAEAESKEDKATVEVVVPGSEAESAPVPLQEARHRAPLDHRSFEPALLAAGATPHRGPPSIH